MGAKPDEVKERERLQGDRRMATNPVRPDVVPKDYQADNKSPEEIRADIARTRAEMSRTVDQLQMKLSPRRLRQQASDATIGRITDMARDTAREVSERTRSASSTIVETVRANPIPAALTALGLGWLIYESTGRNMRSRNVRQYPYPTGMYEHPGGRVRETAGRVQERAGEMVDTVQSKAGEVVDTVQAKASDVVSQAQGQVQEIGHQAQELGQQAQMQVRHARDRVGQMIDETPLVAGVVALAIGAVVGVALPSTPQEQQLMGETRDRLVDRVQEAGQETMEKVQHVAKEVTQTAKETAKEEAKNEGLMH